MAKTDKPSDVVINDGGPEERAIEREAVREGQSDAEGTFVLTRNLAGFPKGEIIDARHQLRGQLKQLFLAGDAVRQVDEDQQQFGAGSLPTF